MTKEQIYTEQLKELGVWEDAFAPEVKTLAMLERRKTRAEKEWSATAPRGGKPSFLYPLYQVVVQLEREILTHREALGLTPKALRKLRGPAAQGPSTEEMISEKLSAIAERVSAYDGEGARETGGASPSPANGDVPVGQAYEVPGIVAGRMEPEEARRWAEALKKAWDDVLGVEGDAKIGESRRDGEEQR